jgi:Regulator of chromosome condensation (RCC1) repeat/Putative Ig domain
MRNSAGFDHGRRRCSIFIRFRLVALAVAGALITATVVAASPTSAAAIPARVQSGGSMVLQLAASDFSTCALLRGGTVQCWGSGYANDPTQPTGTYTEIALGGGGDCGLTATPGPVSCWTAGAGPFATPPGTGSFTQIVGADGDDCALSTTGSVTCWGNDVVSLPGPFTAVAVGPEGVCTIATGGTLACVPTSGPGDYGAPPAGSYSAVSLGYNFGCALTTAQAITCWGNDDYGEAQAPAGTYTAIAAGGEFACAISTRGTVSCWGQGGADQLGSPPGTFSAISAGVAFTCGIETSGYVRCWGDDLVGQLGSAPLANPNPTPSGDLVGTKYFYTLGPTYLDGSPQATFAVTSGTLPPGINLDARYGLLSGTTTSPGAFAFTASIANIFGALTEHYEVIVRGYFLGFRQPAAGARIARPGRRLRVGLRIGSYAGTAVPARYGPGIEVQVALTRRPSGRDRVAASGCRYSTTDRAFECTLHLPRRVSKGDYYLLAYQQSGFGYFPCPPGRAGTDRNPERIYLG